MERLSAIIPATDAPATLETVLRAIRSASDPPEELVVVESPRGAGPAAARNDGAGRAGGDVLVFVDSDVEVHADAFTRIRRAFERDPGVAAVFGSYDDDPRDRGIVSGFRNLLHHHVHQSGAGSASSFWAGLGAIRRTTFLELGGFDATRYPRPSIEDVELGARLVAAGYRVTLDPSIQGTHLKRWTVVSMVRTDLLARGVPWVDLLLARGGDASGLNLAWRHRLSALASLLLAASLVGRSVRGVGVSVAALGALNAPFYLLLLRRRGPAQLAAGVPLHALHHLTASAAVPIAVLAHVRRTLLPR